MKGLALLPVLFLMGCASVCTSGSEFEPPLCPAHVPQIATLSIIQTGQGVSDDMSCKEFTPTEIEVRRFLTQAQETTANGVHYTLPELPCFAAGKMVFMDGRKAEWSVRPLNLGSIVLTDGTEKILYCPDCNFGPFRT